MRMAVFIEFYSLFLDVVLVALCFVSVLPIGIYLPTAAVVARQGVVLTTRHGG